MAKQQKGKRNKGPTKAQIVNAVRQKIRDIEDDLIHKEAPSKRQVQYHGKVTVPIWTQNLQGVPGGGFLKMVAHPETGTRLATKPTIIRLQHSAQHSYTTRGNYII